VKHNTLIRLTTILLTSLLLLVNLISCGGSDSPTEPDPTDELLITDTVGAIGGSIEHEEISLVVPESAFANTAEISLLKVMGDPTGIGQGVAYRIEGLPEVWDEPLTVLFPNPTAGNANKNSDPTFLIGEKIFVSSQSANMEHFRYLESTADSGQWRITIPAIDDLDGKGQITRDNETVRLTVVKSGSTHSVVSSRGLFKVVWTAGHASQDDAEVMAGYLEAAYDVFLDLGFDYGKRSNWPVSVLVRPMEAEAFGKYGSSMLGDNYGSIELNEQHLYQSLSRKNVRRNWFAGNSDRWHLKMMFHQ